MSTLWWTNIAMENHHFSWENPLFLWPFSIGMLLHQREMSPLLALDWTAWRIERTGFYWGSTYSNTLNDLLIKIVRFEALPSFAHWTRLIDYIYIHSHKHGVITMHKQREFFTINVIILFLDWIIRWSVSSWVICLFVVEIQGRFGCAVPLVVRYTLFAGYCWLSFETNREKHVFIAWIIFHSFLETYQGTNPDLHGQFLDFGRNYKKSHWNGWTLWYGSPSDASRPKSSLHVSRLVEPMFGLSLVQSMVTLW